MSDILKFFQRGKKKRDLSGKSETEEDPKKVREGSLDCSQISQTSDILCYYIKSKVLTLLTVLQFYLPV